MITVRDNLQSIKQVGTSSSSIALATESILVC